MLLGEVTSSVSKEIGALKSTGESYLLTFKRRVLLQQMGEKTRREEVWESGITSNVDLAEDILRTEK